jgi:hypothetical protein
MDSQFPASLIAQNNGLLSRNTQELSSRWRVQQSFDLIGRKYRTPDFSGPQTNPMIDTESNLQRTDWPSRHFLTSENSEWFTATKTR